MPLTGTRRNQHPTCIREKRRRHSLKPLKPEKWPTLQPICAAARDYGRMTGKPAVILLAHCVSLLPERESPVERTTHGKHNR